MKLILQYSYSSYEFSSEVILPVEYESEEALIVDFEIALDEAIKDGVYFFNFLGENFNTDHFYFGSLGDPNALKYINDHKNLPEIMTLYRWFDKEKLIKKELNE